jgi:hypothetical protein
MEKTLVIQGNALIAKMNEKSFVHYGAGMNGIVLHGDSLSRKFKDAYFIRNDSADFMAYSEVIKMPHTDAIKKEVSIQVLGK